MDDDALTHCVVAIEGVMRDLRDIVAPTYEQLNAHLIDAPRYIGALVL